MLCKVQSVKSSGNRLEGSVSSVTVFTSPEKTAYAYWPMELSPHTELLAT